MKTKSINHLRLNPMESRFMVNQWYRQLTPFTLRNYLAILVTVIIFSLTGCERSVDDTDQFARMNDSEIDNFQDSHARNALPNAEIARLRAAIAPYHNIDKAMADGYVVEATDNVPHMGVHYLNPAYLMDGQFELEKPELLLYAPAPNGDFRLVAVEYATPIEDLNDPPPPPEGFTGDADVWEINYEVSLWTLHAWIWLHNPDGIFAPFNPRVE